MSPEGLEDISGEQWLFGVFSAPDSLYSVIQEMVHVQRGSESGSNQLNSFLQGGALDGESGGLTQLLIMETSNLHMLLQRLYSLPPHIFTPNKTFTLHLSKSTQIVKEVPICVYFNQMSPIAVISGINSRFRFCLLLLSNERCNLFAAMMVLCLGRA